MGEAAEALGVSRQSLSDVLNGHAALTPTMALRIEKAFGFRIETLTLLQHNHDVAQARALKARSLSRPYVPKMKPEPQPGCCDRRRNTGERSSPQNHGS